MRGTYDKNVNAACLYLSTEKFAKTMVISEEMNFDLNSSGRLVGIEFLNARSQLAEACSACDLRGFPTRAGAQGTVQLP